MKSIIVVLVCLLLIFSAGILSYNFIIDSSRAINTELQGIDQKVRTGKWEEANSQLAVMENKWGSIKDGWAMLIDHQEIDNIDLNLSKMKEYIKAKDNTEALAQISSIKLLFEHIPQKEAFNIKNIL